MTENKLDYSNKVVLAPMVRIGTLPARLLALDYGADLVYTEEIIDYKMLQCQRVENALLGTVDFVLPTDGTVVFRTCSKEKDKVIFQVGTSDAKRALQVAKLVENDVAGFDVNMGCPKDFSIHGGMGAALLKQPEKVKEILTTLVRGLSIPVTCKIRLLPTLEETISFAQMAESCGISAIGIHGRLKEERPRHANHNHDIMAITKTLKIPVIANGGSSEIKCFEDIERFRLDTGASSVMIARAAQWNSSIFRKDGLLPAVDVIKAYLKYAIEYDNRYNNTKYCIQQYYRDSMETDDGQKLMVSANENQIYEIWNMEEYHQQVLQEHQKKAEASGTGGVKRRKLENGKTLVEKSIHISRKLYQSTVPPKVALNNYLNGKTDYAPKYITELHEKLYHSRVEVGDFLYGSTTGDMSKKWSEHTAALVCLQELGVEEELSKYQKKTPSKGAS